MFNTREESERRELTAERWRAKAKRNWRIFGLAFLWLFAAGCVFAFYDSGYWHGFEDGRAEGRIEGVALTIK